jgi:hypothetical protein
MHTDALHTNPLRFVRSFLASLPVAGEFSLLLLAREVTLSAGEMVEYIGDCKLNKLGTVNGEDFQTSDQA